MSPGKLPRDLSGNDFRRAVEPIGFEFKRQRGSHMVLFRAQPPTTLVVPAHAVLKVGLLRKLVDQIGLTIDEFLDCWGEASLYRRDAGRRVARCDRSSPRQASFARRIRNHPLVPGEILNWPVGGPSQARLWARPS